jgi:hypothetical protein
MTQKKPKYVFSYWGFIKDVVSALIAFPIHLLGGTIASLMQFGSDIYYAYHHNRMRDYRDEWK